MQRGFDHQYGPLLGEIDYFTHSAHGTRDWFRDEKPLKENGYVTSLLGSEAVRYIESRDGRTPFFLYLAFTARTRRIRCRRKPWPPTVPPLIRHGNRTWR
jgi:hypothetical protein